MDSLLHSGTCPECKREFCGPIANVDDVKWTLGNMILADPDGAKHNIEMLIENAREMMVMTGLQNQLKDMMEQGFRASYFSEHLRHDIRKIVNEMDQISAGPRMAVDRSCGPPLCFDGPCDAEVGGEQSDARVGEDIPSQEVNGASCPW